jgi:hypothetical protein
MIFHVFLNLLILAVALKTLKSNSDHETVIGFVTDISLFMTRGGGFKNE